MENKILYSKTKFNYFETVLEKEFNECIIDLIDIEEVKGLDNFYQHIKTSRLQHSINVSYYSFIFAKAFGLDYRSAARAGLLHDLFLYDWRTTTLDEHHAFAHPKQALLNAKKIAELNPIEEDAIVKHMWPLCKSMPKYKESLAVSLADKYCCTGEVANAYIAKIKNKFRRKLVNCE